MPTPECHDPAMLPKSRQSTMILAFCLIFAFTANAAVITEDASITGQYLKLVVAPNDGAVITQLGHTATVGDYAGEYGLLLEGFGVGNPYVPQVRSNETLEIDESVPDRPVLRYTYDCQGANIEKFHVVRTIEPLPGEASIRVRWRVENKGGEKQWVVPWVRNDILPGGKFNPEDRIDVPTLSGVRDVRGSGYYPASRNWIASTDPIEQVTVYGVFNAEETHSFLTLWDEQTPSAGFHTAFVPHLLDPGGVWETTYRLNVVRGLRHVDFAASELAAQIEYKPGRIEVLISAARELKDLEIHASVVAPNGRRWKLDPKKFSADPNRLVRCTFDWTAPGDSPFDFLAELRCGGGGGQFVLSGEMATPHGGIDTQFIVGNPAEPIVMPAWTDAPHVLDRGQRTLKRSVAARKPAAVWVESSLEKIHPNDQVEPATQFDNTIRIALAGNERESFQIVVRPELEPLRDIQFKKGTLKNLAANSSIPAENTSIFNVLFQQIRVPSYFEGPTGEWPDALPPFKQFDAAPGRCYPVWFTVYAPPGAPPGLYTGQIVMSAQDTKPVELNVELTVYDFELPPAPALITDFSLGRPPAALGRPPAALGRPPAALGRPPAFVGGVPSVPSATSSPTAAPDRLADAYALDALAHRVTLRESTQLPDPGGDYESKLAQYKPRLMSLLAKGATSVSVPASLLNDRAALKQADKFVKANDLQDVAFCHIAEEPAPPAWPKLVETMKTWTETAPNIPLMITNQGFRPFLPEGVRIWALHLPLMDTLNNKPVLDHIAQGKPAWLYVNHQTPRPYCNFLVDFSSVEHRTLFWQAWALGVQGIRYWAVNYTDPSAEDPYASLVDVTPVNGDGLLVYPGADGPVDSIRLENIRDGIDDYDYLTILMARFREVQKKNPQHPALNRASEALNIKGLVPDLVSFPRDPELLVKKRNEIAHAIMALGKL
jgi:hypothetical protein